MGLREEKMFTSAQAPVHPEQWQISSALWACHGLDKGRCKGSEEKREGGGGGVGGESGGERGPQELASPLMHLSIHLIVRYMASSMRGPVTRLLTTSSRAMMMSAPILFWSQLR